MKNMSRLCLRAHTLAVKSSLWRNGLHLEVDTVTSALLCKEKEKKRLR